MNTKKTPLKLPDSTPHTICPETGLKIYAAKDLPKDVFIRALKENWLSGMASPNLKI